MPARMWGYLLHRVDFLSSILLPIPPPLYGERKETKERKERKESFLVLGGGEGWSLLLQSSPSVFSFIVSFPLFPFPLGSNTFFEQSLSAFAA